MDPGVFPKGWDIFDLIQTKTNPIITFLPISLCRPLTPALPIYVQSVVFAALCFGRSNRYLPQCSIPYGPETKWHTILLCFTFHLSGFASPYLCFLFNHFLHYGFIPLPHLSFPKGADCVYYIPNILFFYRGNRYHLLLFI